MSLLFMNLTFAIITLSDRASRGVYKDESGPAILNILKEAFPSAQVTRVLIPDEARELLQAFQDNIDADWILTTGGTGVGHRDITPDVTKAFCEKEIPGIAEYLRMKSLDQTIYAALSRGTAGMKGKTFIVNLPGSARGAAFCAELLVPLIEHSLKIKAGSGHDS